MMTQPIRSVSTLWRLSLLMTLVIGCDTGGPESSDAGARSDAGMGGSTLATSTGGTQSTPGGRSSTTLSLFTQLGISRHRLAR